MIDAAPGLTPTFKAERTRKVGQGQGATALRGQACVLGCVGSPETITASAPYTGPVPWQCLVKCLPSGYVTCLSPHDRAS